MTTNPGRDTARRHLIVAALVLVFTATQAASAPPPAQEEPPALEEEGPLAALRLEIETLRRDYEARLTELEERIAELEREAVRDDERPGPDANDEELARLRAAAQSEAQSPTPVPTPSAPTVEGARGLNRLNPEISFTANFLGIAASDSREEFRAQEFELDLQSSLDPFSRGRLTLAFGEEGELEVEEGYISYPALKAGLGLTAGKFRQTFGALNRQHLHALPQTDYPLALLTFFGEGGLGQTGVSLDWLLSRPWADANELTVQLTDGENEAFGGEFFDQLALLAHFKNYWDLSDATYFEWGLSGIAGETASGGTSRVWGTDLTLHWQPPQRAKFREFRWRSELLFSQRDDPAGVRRDAWGGYSYVEGLARRNLYLGLRLDRVQQPLDPSRRTWGIVPYLSWWQSEFVRLRAEFQHLEHDADDGSEDRLFLQLTWAAGPHKHETY